MSADGIERFAPTKTLGGGSIRHVAVLVDGSTLFVFDSVIGDAPERLLLSTIRLDSGSPATCRRRLKGPATNVNQLREPYVFQDGGKTYLFYGVGESGIALAELRYELVTP